MGALLASGVAYAAWSTGVSGGSGQVKANTLTFTVNGTVSNSAPANYHSPHPGSVAGTTSGDSTGGDLVVNITNPESYTIYVKTIYQSGAATNSNSSSGCTNDTVTTVGSYSNSTGTFTAPIGYSAGNSGIIVGPTSSPTFTFSPSTTVSVAANTTTDVTVPYALSMASTSNNACQGATFTIPLIAVAATS